MKLAPEQYRSLDPRLSLAYLHKVSSKYQGLCHKIGISSLPTLFSPIISSLALLAVFCRGCNCRPILAEWMVEQSSLLWGKFCQNFISLAQAVLGLIQSAQWKKSGLKHCPFVLHVFRISLLNYFFLSLQCFPRLLYQYLKCVEEEKPAGKRLKFDY